MLTRKGARSSTAPRGRCEREIRQPASRAFLVDKGNHRHFMEKEIYEQPAVIGDTLHQLSRPEGAQGRAADDAAVRLREDRPRSPSSPAAPPTTPGMVAKYWFERYARLPVEVDVASEFRYREPPLPKGGWRSSSRSRARPPTRWRRCATPRPTGRRCWPWSTCPRAPSPVNRTSCCRRWPAPRSASPRPRPSPASSRRCWPAWRSPPAARATLSTRGGGEAGPGADRGAPRISPRRCARGAVRAHGRGSRAGARRALSRPRHLLPARARRRAEAEGDLLHPRRGLCRRRDEARADRADRRGGAGHRGRAAPTRLFEKTVSNMQEVGGARRQDRADQRPAAQPATVEWAGPCGGATIEHARGRRSVRGADPLCRAGAAARLSCGGPQGHRRRPAAAGQGLRLLLPAVHAEPDHRHFLLRAARPGDRARHHGRAGDDADHVGRDGAAQRRRAEEAREPGRERPRRASDFGPGIRLLRRLRHPPVAVDDRPGRIVAVPIADVGFRLFQIPPGTAMNFTQAIASGFKN